MVSFFGLKLGSDRKKAQSKPAQDTAPPKWDRMDQNTLGEGQFYGQNFSRPQFPSSTARPGTANSNRSVSSNWRAVFKNRAMTSSMVDLAPPQRRPSVGSLRHAASDMSLRPGTALPAALGGSGLRPGTPSRPAGASKAEWVNPLDVHFCKDPASSRPGTPRGSNSTAHAAAHPAKAYPKSTINQSSAGHSAGEDEEVNRSTGTRHTPPMATHDRQSDEVPPRQNGYPSPPQSDRNSERDFSPVNSPPPETRSPNSKRNAPSALRTMDVMGPKSLPSPAPSVQRTSEDRPEGPVVRNVPARRDTFAFHQPRRQSFTMEFEGNHRATMMQPPKEGFSGNFEDFDFGDVVTKTTSNASVIGKKSSLETESEASITSDATTEPNREPAPAPLIPNRYSPVKRTERDEPNRSPASTNASEDQVANSTLIDQLPKPPREHAPRILNNAPAATSTPTTLNGGPKISPQQGFQSRFGSESSSRAPPPRPLRSLAPMSASSQKDSGALSPYGPPPDSGNSYMADGPPPPTAERVPSSPFARPPMEGKFPVTKGLPRGRRPGPPPPQVQVSSSADEYALSLPAWSDFDRSEPRRSAMPAPLTPLRPSASYQNESDISTPTSATAPRIPSPTFSSLATTISQSSPTFSTTFGINFDEALSSPTLGGFPSLDRQPSPGIGANSKRVEAHRAPPRPVPVTLPPSAKKDGSVGVKSSTLTEVRGTFI